MHLRQLIAGKFPIYRLSAAVESEESDFGRVGKGKRGHGAGGKVAVFGLLKRCGEVCAAIIPNAKTETLLPIIREYVEPDRTGYTDTLGAYDALDISGFHNRRNDHSKIFADKQNHINRIENF